MFREAYKRANEDIKGDRLILDKAFEMANAPEVKKTPIIRYSFATTAAAAVILIGAIFANPSLFLKDDENGVIEPTMPETEAVVMRTFINETEDDIAEKEILKVDEFTANEEGEHNPVRNKSIRKNDAVYATEVSLDEATENADSMDFGIALLMIDDSYDADDSAADKTGGYGGNSVTGATEAYEEEVVVETGVFSYAEDLLRYKDGGENIRTNSFKNWDVLKINTTDEAVGRAKLECGMEYERAEADFDKSAGVWRITFVGNDGSVVVYINNLGITQMIIFN